MTASRDTDGLLVEWGERLFRRRKGDDDDAALSVAGGRRAKAQLSAANVRRAIQEVVRPGARQVMVKITGGGRGAKAMAAHLRYISRQGQEAAGGHEQTLGVVDERGQQHQGSDAMRRLMADWRSSGAWIPDESPRREAFHIIFSMPSGTRPEALQVSVSATAGQLFEGHRYAMATHLDQGAPHVHVMVRAERRDGVRLNPRKADLERWRSTFARELQVRGVDALATRQAMRGVNRAQAAVWQVRAAEVGRLRKALAPRKGGEKAAAARLAALTAWREVAKALATSDDPLDRRLAEETLAYFADALKRGDIPRTPGGRAGTTRERLVQSTAAGFARPRDGPEVT